jgi:hypothetical protein
VLAMACIVVKKNAYRVLGKNLKERDRLEYLYAEVRIILK